MTVFKGFLKIMQRNMGTVLMYLAIFLGICILIQTATKGEGIVNFEEEKLNVAVIDRDGGVLAKGLTSYIGSHHHLKDILDDKSVIQDELFYRNIAYVVMIPKGFEEKCLKQGEKLETMQIPGTRTAVYVDQQIGDFMNEVRILMEAGFDTAEAVEEAVLIEDTKTEVELLDKSGYGGKIAPHAFVFQYFPYVVLATICYVMSFIMMIFRNKDMRRRMQCSAVSLKRQNAQFVLGYLVGGSALFLICIILPAMLYGKTFLTDGNLWLYIANVGLLILVALAISFIIGIVVQKNVVVNGLVNVISLGMCFLCGVFVPLEMLGDGVKVAAKFLPVYWYEVANGIISKHAQFTAWQQADILKAYGIQFLFAAAIFCCGLVISKYRTRE